jgi:uncharacterized membrane protein YidH (DUF202 family)
MKRDGGLQPERTALAWKRTALAATVDALLALRAGMQAHESVVTWLGVVLVPVAFLLALAAAGRRRTLLHTACAPAPGLMFLTAAGVGLAATTAMLIYGK